MYVSLRCAPAVLCSTCVEGMCYVDVVCAPCGFVVCAQTCVEEREGTGILDQGKGWGKEGVMLVIELFRGWVRRECLVGG